MARPRKTGLDYFSLDVDFFSDEKVVCVSAEYGAKGEAVIIRLLCAIYRNGYFAPWTDMLRLKIAKDTPDASPGLVDQVVASAARWGLFDENLYKQERILTSRGIQRRYFEAARLRCFDGEPPWLLIPKSEIPARFGVSDEKTPGFHEETPVSSEKTPQSKVKERKDKRKDSQGGVKKNAARRGVCPPPPGEKEIFDFFKSEGLESSPERFRDYYQARGWKTGGAPVTDWRALARLWDSRRDMPQPGQTPGGKPASTAADVELMRQTDRRHAEEEAARKAREARDNPDGLSPAQALADFKRRNGLSPGQSPADLLGRRGVPQPTTTPHQ